MSANKRPDPNSLGWQCRVARVELGLSIEEAAKRIGVHPTSLSQAETGARPLTMNMLRRISKAYGVSVGIRLERRGQGYVHLSPEIDALCEETD